MGLKPQRIGHIKNSYWNVAFIHKHVSDFSIREGIGTSKNCENQNFKGDFLERTHLAKYHCGIVLLILQVPNKITK